MVESATIFERDWLCVFAGIELVIARQRLVYLVTIGKQPLEYPLECLVSVFVVDRDIVVDLCTCTRQSHFERS